MKKILIAILALSFVFALSSCGAGGNNDIGNTGNGAFLPWDNLGGGGAASGGEVSESEVSEYLPDVSIGEGQTQTEDADATSIDLTAIEAGTASAPEGTTYKNGKLTIVNGGVYALTGNLNGYISVDGTDSDIRLVLKGVSVSTPETETSAALVFKETSALRVLTVSDGTTNTFSDSVGDTDADGDGAAIRAKKCSLTVNGGGTLVLNGKGENASGLKVKKELYVLGTTICITAVNNGVKADEKAYFSDANISVKAGGDGIKTDLEPSSETEAAEYAADKNIGVIYVKNSSFDVEAGDDGFSANNSVYFDCTEADSIRILSGGGAPSKITEASSDAANGKGVKTDGVTFTEGTTETDVPAGYEENYSLVVTGGTFEIDSNSDGLSSKGNLFVTGGTIRISSGDDGVHAEYLTKISGGKIDVEKSYEGIEGGAVEIFGGEISVTSVDDGINAANADLKNYDYHIYIGGGTVFVDASGDGIDSNGWMTVEGGDVTVYGPTGSGNNALDSDRGILVNGGNLAAFGPIGMAENPSVDSAQCYIGISLSSVQAAGTTVCVYDENDELLYTVSPSKAFQTAILSLSSFERGKTYTVTVGDSAYTATLSATGTALGVNSQGGGNQGFRPGGFPGGKR